MASHICIYSSEATLNITCFEEEQGSILSMEYEICVSDINFNFNIKSKSIPQLRKCCT